jgi:hypothetical protein
MMEQVWVGTIRAALSGYPGPSDLAAQGLTQTHYTYMAVP